MSVKHPDTPEPPNSRISWSIYVLILACFCLIGGLLAPFGLFHFLSGRACFWVALGFGCVTALVVNLLRPRYDSATGRWRVIYDYLLKQLPPPD
jgi:hypothetical protein